MGKTVLLANLLNCTIARVIPSERNFNRSLIHVLRPSISRFFISLPGNFGKLFVDSAAVAATATRRNNYRRRACRLFANYANGGLDQWLPERLLSGRMSGVYPSRGAATTVAAAIAAPTASRNPR